MVTGARSVLFSVSLKHAGKFYRILFVCGRKLKEIFLRFTWSTLQENIIKKKRKRIVRGALEVQKTNHSVHL